MSPSARNHVEWHEPYARIMEEDHEWQPASLDDEGALAVLQVVPDDADHLAVMPAEGVLSEAPMGDYDIFELSVFAHPVARLRWCVEDGVGVFGPVTRVGDSDLPDDAVVPVLVEAALDEAWQEGAEVIVAVVPTGVRGAYQRAGWQLKETVRPA
jgi:hypothetical protein